MSNLNQYNRILYKLDDSAGWFYAEMLGDEKTCQEKCKKLKFQNKWFDYKLYGECKTVESVPEFKNCTPDAYTTHQTTNLIYLPELNKWYEPDEIMPMPTSKCEITDEFSVDFYFDEIMNDGDFDEGEEPYITVNLKFKSRVQKNEICVIWEWLIGDIKKLIESVQQNKYTNIIVEEYSYAKILALPIEDKVRFIIQDYGNQDMEIAFDALINKQNFMAELIKIVEKIEKVRLQKFKHFYKK
jgi:hypothetical protein